MVAFIQKAHGCIYFYKAIEAQEAQLAISDSRSVLQEQQWHNQVLDTPRYLARYPQVSTLGIWNSHVEPVSLTLAKLAYASLPKANGFYLATHTS